MLASPPGQTGQAARSRGEPLGRIENVVILDLILPEDAGETLENVQSVQPETCCRHPRERPPHSGGQIHQYTLDV
jgi:hypothetical protein